MSASTKMKVDLQPSKHNQTALPKKPAKNQKKKRWPIFVLKAGLYFLVFLILLGFSLSYKVILSSEGIFSRQQVGFFDQIKRLVTSGDKQIKGEELDRVNILLVGMGGPGHDGAYLSDTIIVASLKPSTREVALLSIPRDLLVEIPKYGWRKINNANAFGYMEDSKKGGEWLLDSVLEEVLSQPIQYYASVDFSGFRKIVDLLAGLEINVERSFTDYEYPDYKHGYQTISFKQGLQKMNGEQALQYVRSRHGNNGEGSDFARSKRQQAVLAAMKKKIFSLGTLANPKRIIEISETLGEHLKTDMEPWEMMRLYSLLGEIDTSKIVTRALDSTASGLLRVTSGIDGAYLLEPRSGDYEEIQEMFRAIFQYSALVKEDAKIEIQNGTQIAGLAETIAQHLRELNLNIVKVTNAQDKKYAETQIYDLRFGEKPETVKELKRELGGSVTTSLPAFRSDTALENINPETNTHPLESTISNLTNTPLPKAEETDILVILGSDIVKQIPDWNAAETNTNL